ncbi:MAG TPA: LUD domain-containing protein [Propionibacteriaceae bacterium]|nr:LUD domain-containing protein [Propionibacteriaceae bacterium]
MSARDDVLGRIRTAHTAAPPPDLPFDEIVREYLTRSDLVGADLVERLVDRLIDYKALVRHSAAVDLPAAVGAALGDRGVRRLAVPNGVPAEWLGDTHLQRLTDGGDTGRLTVEELDDCDAVLTGCAVAVAETGTLILDGSADQGRRVISLIPDYHLCIVRAHQIVGDIPEALTRLDPARPLTMISGPSATSDIELNRVEGVHGPRTLEVIIVDAAPGAS